MALNTLSRRFVLRGAGGATLALPSLGSLIPKFAEGAAPGNAKCFIVLKSFSTQLVKEWYPRLTGNGYALKDSKYPGSSKADGTTLLTRSLVAGKPYTWAPLSDFQTPTGISGILGPALNPHLSKLTLIRGLDFLPAVNHNYGALLGNFSSCTNATPCTADKLADVPTIDSVMAYSRKVYPQVPAVRALHLSQGVSNSMSYSDLGNPQQAVTQQQARTNPLDAFNDLFANFSAPTPGGVDKDKLLIDKVYQDYVKLKNHRRLSAADKQVLDQYTTLIAELQAKLSSTPMMTCVKPAAPNSLTNNNNTDPTDIAKKWELFLDVVKAAVMCGQTRVITIAVHKALGPGPDANNAQLFGHYHTEDASGGTWHGLAHDFGNPNARRMLAGINKWIAENIFAKLVAKLDVPESGGRTFLDNSLIYWGNELAFNHLSYSVPCVLAGGAGGFITPGRYLDYIDWDGRAYFSQEDGNVIAGIPHNRFLVTCLQAMGLDPQDYERGGQKGYGSTSTESKDPNLWATNYDFNAIGEILPGIR
jgi:Protein of unknown function (DUF1552)